MVNESAELLFQKIQNGNTEKSGRKIKT